MKRAHLQDATIFNEHCLVILKKKVDEAKEMGCDCEGGFYGLTVRLTDIGLGDNITLSSWRLYRFQKWPKDRKLVEGANFNSILLFLFISLNVNLERNLMLSFLGDQRYSRVAYSCT